MSLKKGLLLNPRLKIPHPHCVGFHIDQPSPKGWPSHRRLSLLFTYLVDRECWCVCSKHTVLWNELKHTEQKSYECCQKPCCQQEKCHEKEDIALLQYEQTSSTSLITLCLMLRSSNTASITMSALSKPYKSTSKNQDVVLCTPLLDQFEADHSRSSLSDFTAHPPSPRPHSLQLRNPPPSPLGKCIPCFSPVWQVPWCWVITWFSTHHQAHRSTSLMRWILHQNVCIAIFRPGRKVLVCFCVNACSLLAQESR